MKYHAPAILPVVTDHALLRYLERRHNIDTEAARAEIARHTAVAAGHGHVNVIWDCCRFVVKNGHVVTTLALDMIPHPDRPS